MSANLWDASTASLKPDADGVYLSGTVGELWCNFASTSVLTENQTVHMGASLRGADKGSLKPYVGYKDAAGRYNYVGFPLWKPTGQWQRFEGSCVVPSGMTITYFGFNISGTTGAIEVYSPMFSYDSPIALAVAEITAADVKDGKGIKSTAITYQAAPTQTVTPTGTWSESVPSLSESNPYLWTRTVITYTDNTTSTSYSVSSAITDPRINSTIIKHEQEYYLSTSDTSLAGGSWSTTFPTRKDGTFYWVRYKDTHANKAVTYDPSANGKLLTEVNEVWAQIKDNSSSIAQTNKQINISAQTITSIENKLDTKISSEDFNNSNKQTVDVLTEIRRQVAELKVQSDSITAKVTDNQQAIGEVRQATAQLTTDGLNVDTGLTTISTVDGKGLTVKDKNSGETIANFTTGESLIQNLRVKQGIKVGAHMISKMPDTEYDGSTKQGTGFMWVE